MVLLVEKDEKLLTEYGRVFAYINIVEGNLDIFISCQSGLTTDSKIIYKILDELMMGKKINIAKEFLSKDLIKKLWRLNDNRILLAHGVVSEEVSDNIAIGTGKLLINHKHKKTPFDISFLEETFELAKETLDELQEEIVKLP